MLLLRYEIAKNRGFGDELELAILAKMMLAEYYETDFYKELPNHLDSEGNGEKYRKYFLIFKKWSKTRKQWKQKSVGMI